MEGALRSPVGRQWQIGRHRNHVADAHTGIHSLKIEKALEKEQRAADQYK
jgi:hypothetical protein